MAIQMRRGNEADLDISRLLPGELAICLDAGKVIIKLAGGNYLTLTDSVALSALISGKAPASHTHTKSQITDLANATTSAAGLMSATDKTKLDACKKIVVCNSESAYNSLTIAIQQISKTRNKN